jgi:hypothetical protein
MDHIDWEPYLKASCERNNISFKEVYNLDLPEIFSKLELFENISIYDGLRLATPDEVWNFNRGDGIERAILFASVISNRKPENRIQIEIIYPEVLLKTEGITYNFITKKRFELQIIIENREYTVTKI